MDDEEYAAKCDGSAYQTYDVGDSGYTGTLVECLEFGLLDDDTVAVEWHDQNDRQCKLFNAFTATEDAGGGSHRD